MRTIGNNEERATSAEKMVNAANARGGSRPRQRRQQTRSRLVLFQKAAAAASPFHATTREDVRYAAGRVAAVVVIVVVVVAAAAAAAVVVGAVGHRTCAHTLAARYARRRLHPHTRARAYAFRSNDYDRQVARIGESAVFRRRRRRSAPTPKRRTFALHTHKTPHHSRRRRCGRGDATNVRVRGRWRWRRATAAEAAAAASGGERLALCGALSSGQPPLPLTESFGDRHSLAGRFAARRRRRQSRRGSARCAQHASLCDDGGDGGGGVLRARRSSSRPSLSALSDLEARTCAGVSARVVWVRSFTSGGNLGIQTRLHAHRPLANCARAEIFGRALARHRQKLNALVLTSK